MDEQVITPATSSTTRRAVLAAGAALGAAVPFLARGSEPADADSTTGLPRPTSGAARSALAAFSFLQHVTDTDKTTGLRLVRSYDDSSGGPIGFLYDNALTCIALLAAGDWPRAKAIGEALVYAQEHNWWPQDGRLHLAYDVTSFIHDDGLAYFYNNGSVGREGWTTPTNDLAWAAIAFAHLARRTGRASYLNAARRAAGWLLQQRADDALGGFGPGAVPPPYDKYRLTEHNILLFALFRLMEELTGETSWHEPAQHALDFVHRTWNATDGFFWAGSDDSTTINKTATQFPLNAQTLYWLAAGELQGEPAGCRHCLDWARTCLATTDTPSRANSQLQGSYAVSGVAYGSGTLRADVSKEVPFSGVMPDDGAVWFEGNAQLALALHLRNASKDRDRAAALIAEVRSAQDNLHQHRTYKARVIPGGVVEASSPLDTGFDLTRGQALSTGTTAWYLISAMKNNPLRF